MQNFVISRAKLVEVNIPVVSAGQQYNFSEDQELSSVYLHGIEAFCDTQLSKTPTGKTVIAAACVKEVVLVLCVESEQRLQQVPLYTLVSGSNAGLIRQLAHLKINLTKSYIQLVDANITATHSVAFALYFHKNKPVQNYR